MGTTQMGTTQMGPELCCWRVSSEAPGVVQLINEDESDRDDDSKCAARLYAGAESQLEVPTIARSICGINIGCKGSYVYIKHR